jgi:4-methyl-5(b-hydroxyethyl)-thiazole monophosphate biosynthesis
MSNTFIFLAEGFEETEAITIVDLLRRASINVTTISVTGTTLVTGSHAISIKADALFEEIDFLQADLLILPGGMPGSNNLAKHKGLSDLLQLHNKKNKFIAAICAAPTVLGKLKILKNREVICYPGFEMDLLGANISHKTLVQDFNIITAKGPGYAIDFALYLICLLKGADKKKEVADNFLYIL